MTSTHSLNDDDDVPLSFIKCRAHIGGAADAPQKLKDTGFFFDCASFCTVFGMLCT